MTSSPVESIPTDLATRQPEDGMALCLSGGGYRAMVFHIGVLWRLHETGLLHQLKRVSSVSGGSITAGFLALKWHDLSFKPNSTTTEFVPRIVAPLRALAGETIDAESVIFGVLMPGTIADRIAAAYDKALFKGATLQDLTDAPRFIINATNVQSGALWRFSKRYMRDYRVGEVVDPKLPLAQAVAASSAFPPVLSPCQLRLDPASFTPNSGTDLQKPPYTSKVVLTDGGVYDNLGLETAWKRYKTILVSDAGGKMAPEEEPKTDWARHSYRVLSLVDNQVRSLRKRQVIDSFEQGARAGAYWGIRTDIADYHLPDALPCPFDKTLQLADIATRLKRLDDQTLDRLINWGYAVCDAALRKWVMQS
ncbi:MULTISPECIES: patatin-like phospholipase family protein [Rhodopseudomonas]|uniref:patatin-like phospholipase family protein n=1 Tax=Rhodopseudomonas TaxID=1073 RepID=UPI000698CF99|nr:MULTISPECIES: patatin-like phospholipase family protein [Rhodopseudomonas]MDF3811963.1 patatin-like phospholipase family protein [Rhodopseudomonas sp. BAL398]WOK19996.1 patatin-like phospholipase family protein [Rhodopseudomonas sp. BAL398]